MRGFIDRVPSHSRVLAGGETVGDRGYFFAPTVVGGLRQDDEIIQQEVFGPVITVQELQRRVRSTGLGKRRALRPGLECVDQRPRPGHAHGPAISIFGCVWINTHIPMVAEMPHGGFKHSGYGKDLSMYGFEDYTRIKHVMSYIVG